MTREKIIIANLQTGRIYRKEATTNGISHDTISYDPSTGEYHQTTHYERYNPADDGPMTFDDAEEAAWHIQQFHFQLVPES